MIKLGDLYSDFSRIDLDTRGGYARVAEARTNSNDNFPEICAFKIMRHEIMYAEGIKRFEEELKLLTAITNDQNAPNAITKIYDSGFVPVELSVSFYEREPPSKGLEIIRTGLDIQNFLDQRSKLEKDSPNHWLPYLIIELAPYDDSLLRQIHNQPTEDHDGLFRFSTGDVIITALQLLEVMDYLHKKHGRAYIDWKPEHVHWNGTNMQVKLIDWNITTQLDESPGQEQNIKDDLRLFCGAVLYVSLAFADPDDPTKPIGPRPTKELESPVHELRRRYLTEKPNFYQREITLDSKIKKIICKGLHPRDGYDSIVNLRETLVDYARVELGVTEEELTLRSKPLTHYFSALTNVHIAQYKLFQAQQNLYEAIKLSGNKDEFKRLFEAVNRALRNFPTT